ncbi:hypothetical protein D9M68_256430 [compost metagenome]
MLLVELVELAEVVAGAQLVVPLVGGAGEVEVIRRGAAGVGDVAHAARAGVGVAAVGDDHVLVVRGVALVVLAQTPGVDGQAVDLQGVQLAAAEGLRQQTAVVGLHHRQLGHQGADLQGALRRAQLGGQAEFAVFVVGGLTGLRVTLEQAGAGAIRAGVELETEQADGVHADADGALGVAGLQAQQETLRPLFLFGLRGAFLAEIAVEVEVAQLQAAFAVLDELRLSQTWNGQSAERGQGHGTGERGGVHYCVFSSWYDRRFVTVLLHAEIKHKIYHPAFRP